MRSAGKGGTSMYLPYDDNIGVLYSLALKCTTADEFKTVIDEVWRLHEDGNKVAPILGYVTADDGKGVENTRYKPDEHLGYRDVVLVARAPGYTLNDTAHIKKWYYKTRERLKGPDGNYDSAVETFWNLVHSKVREDISGNNILHQKTVGFNFIDFNKLKTEKPDLRESTARFLHSFVLKKNFPNTETAEEYKDYTRQEQRILTAKLYDIGVPEGDLSYGIKQIPLLGCRSVDDLFSK